jgi:hypothetical protein
VKSRSTSLRAHISLDGETVKSTRHQNRLFAVYTSIVSFSFTEEQMSQPVLLVDTSGTHVAWKHRPVVPMCYLRQTGYAAWRALATRRHTKTREAAGEQHSRHSPLSVRRSLLGSRVVSLFALSSPRFRLLPYMLSEVVSVRVATHSCQKN